MQGLYTRLADLSAGDSWMIRQNSWQPVENSAFTAFFERKKILKFSVFHKSG